MSLQKYRRALIRPLDELTEDVVREGDVPEPGDLEVCRIPDELYERHFALFNDLDRVCGVGGDDHTVEEVEVDRLDRLIGVLRTYPCRDDPALADLLDRMWGLCDRARRAGRSVFFVL